MNKVIELCRGEVEQVSGGGHFSDTFRTIGYDLGDYIDTTIGKNINDIIDSKQLFLEAVVTGSVLVAAASVGAALIYRNIAARYI